MFYLLVLCLLDFDLASFRVCLFSDLPWVLGLAILSFLGCDFSGFWV